MITLKRLSTGVPPAEPLTRVCAWRPTQTPRQLAPALQPPWRGVAVRVHLLLWLLSGGLSLSRSATEVLTLWLSVDHFWGPL